MSRASALLRLQNIDLTLDAHRARLAAIEQALSENVALSAAREAVATAQATAATLRAQAQGLEWEVQSLADKIAAAEARLYSSRGVHFKELKDQQLETEALRRQHAAAEERHLEVLIQLESAEETLNAARQHLDAVESEAAQKGGALADERRELLSRLERLAVEREAICAAIPPADQEIYARLRGAHHGRALTTVEDGACAICGVAQSSARIQEARQGNALVYCGNCGRILYAESDHAQIAISLDD